MPIPIYTEPKISKEKRVTFKEPSTSKSNRGDRSRKTQTVDEALSEFGMRDYSSIGDLAKTIEKRRKEMENEKTNNPSTLIESSSKQDTSKKNKSKKANSVVLRNL